jgi:pyrroloquinoline quinone (PQQ) biosynthesis protein C
MRPEHFAARRIVADPLEGVGFEDAQRALARHNKERLAPGLGAVPSAAARAEARHMAQLEEAFIEAARLVVAARAAQAPNEADAFIRWFEDLRENGPGQCDALFPWLAQHATREQMRWFLFQEVAGEAGFEDLVAMAQVKMPVRAKLEMARNYWDEMGRGQEKGMHGPMLDRLARHFGLAPTPETTVAESLALGNMMMGLAANRHYAFHALGALGAIEMTAPTRAGFVAEGLRRIGVPDKQSHYFFLHAVLDVKHSHAWNAEVLHSLVAEDGRRARAIAEGALLRLWCGQRCFERYRQEFGI